MIERDPAATRVLLIDDSPISVEVTSHVLRRAGYDVRAATTAKEFEQLLAEWWPQVTIIDVEMPDIDGATLCRLLKQRIAVQVILFSDHSDAELAALAASAGADAYLSKARGFERLPDVVAQLAGAAQADATPAAERKRVLLFDDSELSLQVEESLLTRAGFDVALASKLDEFRMKLAVWAPHVVLVDVQMPEIDGAALCRELKSRGGSQGTAVVLFSSLPETELAVLANRAGADGHLSKQSDYRDLSVRVQDVCDSILWSAS